MSELGPDYRDLEFPVRALANANKYRIIWGSDWPHTNGQLPGKKPTDTFPFIPVDDAHLFNLFGAWVPNAAQRKQILVDNPSRLYRFTDV